LGLAVVCNLALQSLQRVLPGPCNSSLGPNQFLPVFGKVAVLLTIKRKQNAADTWFDEVLLTV
jgi:hypothetical protein